MKVLSIRQPWAWLIVHNHKPLENRTWFTLYRGPFLVHAGKTMTRPDYEACQIFIAGLELPAPVILPDFEDLKRQTGGIVGQSNIVDCVQHSDSPWYTGDYGFVLSGSQPLPFFPCPGALGFFEPPAGYSLTTPPLSSTPHPTAPARPQTVSPPSAPAR